MKPISPWSVKGVDDDAREMARIAANAAGLTLGAWIDRAIKKSAGLPPASPKFVPVTTAGTTFSQESPGERGESLTAVDPMTPVGLGSSDEPGEKFGVSEFATSDVPGSSDETGENTEVSEFSPLDAQGAPDVQVEKIGVSESVTLGAPASPDGRGESFGVSEWTTSDAQAVPNEPSDGKAPTHVFDAGEADLIETATPHGLHAESEERFAATVEPRVTSRTRGWPKLSGLRRAVVPRIALVAAAVVVCAGVVVYGFGYSGSADQDVSASPTEGVIASATATPVPPAPERPDQEDTAPPSEPGVIEMLTAAAEQGAAVAQHDLAARYLDGRAVERDLDLAIKWLQRAASQGMAAAQYRLAAMYDDGTGVKADRNLAAMWHTRAASQGHPASQHALALAYATGRGVKPSEASAIVWQQRAARAGNVASQVLLAERYEDGRGVERSAAKAAEWYASAAAKGHEGAAEKMKQLGAATVGKPTAAANPKPSAKPSPPADAPFDKAGVAEVQRLLTRLAFKPGPADGVLGERTVGEIKLYQSFAGLKDDGKATSGLLQELRAMVRGMSAESAPSP
jgi:TPR repeat protein